MRWLFIFLIFLNLFFYAWQRHQGIENASFNNSALEQSDENIASIRLVSEQPTSNSSPSSSPTTNKDNIMPDEIPHSIDKKTPYHSPQKNH